MYGFNTAFRCAEMGFRAKLFEGGADGGADEHRGQVQRLCRNFFTLTLHQIRMTPHP